MNNNQIQGYAVVSVKQSENKRPASYTRVNPNMISTAIALLMLVITACTSVALSAEAESSVVATPTFSQRYAEGMRQASIGIGASQSEISAEMTSQQAELSTFSERYAEGMRQVSIEAR